MNKIKLSSQVLNKEQIKRCYDVYDFTDDEDIKFAYYDTDYNQLYIQYEDAAGHLGMYEPRCSDDESYNKLLYILKGEKK
jgi:hypothetical protein